MNTARFYFATEHDPLGGVMNVFAHPRLDELAKMQREYGYPGVRISWTRGEPADRLDLGGRDVYGRS